MIFSNCSGINKKSNEKGDYDKNDEKYMLFESAYIVIKKKIID